MNAEQTADLARKLLDTHGLHFWQFEFNRQKRSLGLCYFPSPSYPGRISLSKHFIELNSHEKIRETLLHEIAHALSWERHRYKGHGKIWKEIARQIGCVPERCCNDTDLIMPEIVHHTIYTATCSLCSKLHDFFEERCINFMRNHQLGNTTYAQDIYLRIIAFFEWKLR
jgi:predicted SprT family Zn-dependent metalloprotease